MAKGQALGELLSADKPGSEATVALATGGEVVLTRGMTLYICYIASLRKYTIYRVAHK